MCGIFGSYNSEHNTDYALSLLKHRGPDSEGGYAFNNVFFYHYRLSIIGNNSTAHQPMISFNKKLVMIFNGEVYNYVELADAMGKTSLVAEGDSRVLIEFISKYGFSRLDQLNGMYAFVIYYPDTNEIYLVRDRFGIKPLYYCEINSSLYFSSEIKALLNIYPRKIDGMQLTSYLDMGVYPSGVSTFYNGINQVESGTFIKYQQGKLTTKRYYDLKKEYLKVDNTKNKIERYESLMEDAIKLRLRSDVPISVHYSGGTDSTALLLKAKQVCGKKFPLSAYSIAFSDRDFDESHYAESYCKRIGVKHKKVFLSYDEVPSLAEEMSYFQDEPYGGIPTIAYYKLNKVQRDDGFVVSLEGQGGDETFGGYLYHIYLAAYDLIKSGCNKEVLDCILSELNTTLADVISVSERLISHGFVSHTDLTNLGRSPSGIKREFINNWLTSIQIYDILENKIPRTMRFNDRASMAASREIRFPLLDHRLLELGLSLKHSEKYADGLSKFPLRKIIKKSLKDVYSISKRSVVTPQTYWLLNQLSSWAKERIKLLKGTGVIDERYFHHVDQFFIDPNQSNSFKVWQLINLSYLIT